ncbi:uncharacterized protein LOC143548704 [Bidens hawaiensis]|uniref:uncharacterized protein LOC143548704 n=1 Tax=Bidens hawaiensis TaxID=980011 RepID=UPI00404992A7
MPPTTLEPSAGSSKQVKQDHNGSSGSHNRSRSNQAGPPTSAGRKTQGVNGNYLLNFHYDPISRPKERANLPRKLPKRKPYNKDLFLQANYKFVLIDSGNRAPESMDPDKMFQWEDIVCVKYFTPHETKCPICLEEYLCPQMTSCGHIFCFSCILRYFLIGEDDHKRECWKKCPLCFMMISSKDLYTIYIENVKQHRVGDVVEFMLLTRDKDSLTLTSKQKVDFDSFSKFTFTADAELAVREPMSDLDRWLAKAESGLVDDMEGLPYVCAAMEQLEERKKFWGENRSVDLVNHRKNDSFRVGSPPNLKYWKENRNVDLVNHQKNDSFDVGSPPNLNLGTDFNGSVMSEESFSKSVNVNGPLFNQTADVDELNDGFTDKKAKGSYEFYQAVDGQHLILHPLNMKCLLHHFGSYDKLPQRISGKALQLETITQSEAMRRRYRYLSHFSLTTTFQFCEIDLSGILPPNSLSPFEDELKNREKQRKRVARKEQEEKKKAEAAAKHYVPVVYDTQSSYNYSPEFSLDDFEALGSSSVTSSSPPTVVDRPLFSNVTRLGFAAAHDSPNLGRKETDVSSGSATGLHTGGTTSFANVIGRAKPVEGNNASETGKKGKKGSRVLLSTSGGRRY